MGSAVLKLIEPIPEPAQPSLNIVFVCFNCGADICAVIDDLAAGNYPFADTMVYIVDNDSSDDSVARLQALPYSNVRVIPSNRNLGFGAGCNLAVRHIIGAAPILFLNPDVRLFADSIANLMDCAQRQPQRLIWGGLTCSADGQPDGKSAWREPSLTGVLCWSLCLDPLLKAFGGQNPDAYPRRHLRGEASVDAVSGCCLLVDSQLFARLQGFDERFFLYSEEIDLCRRARVLGARPLVSDRVRVIHIGSKTVSSINKVHFLYQSKLKYFRKHRSVAACIAARLAITAGCALRIGAFALLSLHKREYDSQRRLWWSFLKRQLRESY